MIYVIIGVALLFIIVPIIGVLPSARQKEQMKMRKSARTAGVSVELTTISDPNPHQDKYVSPTGKAIAPLLKVVGYRLQRKRARDWRQLPQVDWCLQKMPDKNWRWQLGPSDSMNTELIDWLNNAIEALPEDVEQVEEVNYNITVYWHEKTKGSETTLFDFLKHCADQALHAPSEDDAPG